MTTARDLHDALDQLDGARAELEGLPAGTPERIVVIHQMTADFAEAAVAGIERALLPDVVARVHQERATRGAS